MADVRHDARLLPGWIRTALDWTHARQQILVAVVVALQLLVLVAMIVGRATPLVTGDTILVRVVPVDPRDFFRGDYVILSYEFSRVDTDQLTGPGTPPAGSKPAAWAGTTVYVPLEREEDGRHWRAAGPATLTPPGTGRYIRGTITGYQRAAFGIESYFVQEGEGRAWEEALRSQTLSAEIALTKDGSAALKGLVID